MTVPIKKAARETAIKDIEIDNTQDWKGKILGQLTAYKRKAPKYKETTAVLYDILNSSDMTLLSRLNFHILKSIANYLGIECDFDVFSEMNLAVSDVSEPDEWALNISKALGANEYVNPPGGITFFDKNKYDNVGIELKFLKSNLKPYIQRIGRWEPGLSIIDVMMFCDKDEILDILKDYTFM